VDAFNKYPCERIYAEIEEAQEYEEVQPRMLGNFLQTRQVSQLQQFR
jgi:hypothetical protein